VARPKQKPIKISGLEQTLLQDYAKRSPLILVRSKAQAILLAAMGGQPDATAVMLDRKTRTVENWIRDWRNFRLASIFSKHQGNNNAGKLTKDQLEEIQQTLQSPPSDFGLSKEFWDLPALKDYLSAEFGTVYESDESYYFLLRFSGLSFKYPDTFDLKRDEAFIEQRMKEIKTEITSLLTDDNWEVFACDEVKMQQEAIIRKAWLKKGERTIVKVNRKKESQSYIGFLNQKNGACEVYEMEGRQNSQTVLEAMKLFLTNHPNKKICVVWDNAPFHKSKAIREELRTGGIMEQVHLIAMPPYAPDNNPIEHVWNTAKKATANIQHKTFEDTKQAFSDFVASRLFAYEF
jgi:transposase